MVSVTGVDSPIGVDHDCFGNPRGKRSMARVRYWVGSLILGLASLASPSSSQLVAQELAQELNEQTALFDDFDTVGIGERWTLIGQDATASRSDAPAQAPLDGISGKILNVKFVPGSILAMKQEIAWPVLETPSAIRFRVRALQAAEDDPERLEIQVYSRERRAWRWHKVVLTNTDWQMLELPLRWFRHSGKSHVDWSEAQRFAVYSSTAGEVQFDRIELVQDQALTGTNLLPAELSAMAFGDRGKVTVDGPFALITDANDLDTDAILERLHELHRSTNELLGEFEHREGSVPLIVFSQGSDFQEFFPKLGAVLNATVSSPRTQGYTVFGIACCVRSDDFGPVRPIYVHETCHAMLAQRLGIDNSNEWLHEGMASHFQSRLLAQDDNRREIAADVLRSPAAWDKLLSGEAIELADYAEAMFLIEWMLSEPARRERFLESLGKFRSVGSTKFDELVIEASGMSVEEARIDWLRYVESQLE